MLRVALYDPTKRTVSTGGEDLLATWSQSNTSLLWVDLCDHPAESETRLMTEVFDLHPLAIQDAQRDRHPPKLESFSANVFMLLKGLAADVEELEFETIQLAIFLGQRFFITRRSGPSPSTERVWQEVQADAQKFARGVDALAVNLTGVVVRRYLNLLLTLEPRLERLEQDMIADPNDEMLAELIGCKSELKKFRRVFAYHVQIFDTLRHQQHVCISHDLKHEINDVYDQQERANSLCSLYYELASDLIDGYISLASHRLNHIIKILTIVTAIFVPLTFIAGIYGMNFANMPELQSPLGYFMVLGAMAIIAGSLLYVFRRIKWI